MQPVALVTGAGRGIGAAIALRLARAGAAVVCAARSLESVHDTADAIKAEGGLAWAVHLDVTDPATYDDAVAELEPELERRGGVWWLVNNAGIAETAPFLRHERETGVDIYEKHLRTNFHGPRRLIERFAPAMLERGHGRIVNVASSAGLRGYPYAAAYVASKHALVGYTRCAAAELAGKGVTLNLVCPHYVDSPMTDGTVGRIVKKTGRDPAEVRAFLAKENPGGSLVSCEEIADVVARLAGGDRNGMLVELVGGRGLIPDHEAEQWRTA